MTHHHTLKPEPTPAPTGFWWCKDCNRKIDAQEVTFSEHHDPNKGGCGDELEWHDRPTSEPVTEAQSIAALEATIARLRASQTLTVHDQQVARIQALEEENGRLWNTIRAACDKLGAILKEGRPK